MMQIETVLIVKTLSSIIIGLDIPILLHFISGLDVFVGSTVRVISSAVFENVLVDRR